MLTERQQTILGVIIEDYIRTARPISSHELARGGARLSVSPATIRNEMLELDELGYTAQPHTSAGRIPTDQGYRFFVDHLLTGIRLRERERKQMDGAFAFAEAEEFVRELSRTVARLSHTLTAVGSSEDGLFYETGFTELLEEPEFQNPEFIRPLGRLIDTFSEEVRHFNEKGDETDEQMFIGRENPRKEARSCTITVTSWKHPKGFEGFLTMLGPTRMDYQKQKALLAYLHDFSNNL